MDKSLQRIGYACKISSSHDRELQKKCHTRTTTATWLRKQDAITQRRTIDDLVDHNLRSLTHLIEHTYRSTPSSMVRISSDLLPLFTHPEFEHFYDDSDIIDMIELRLFSIGKLAAARDIRLSFHPGQFCCLASDRPEVIDNSVEEFHYHSWMAACINRGAPQQVPCPKVNVHLSGRGGAEKFREVFRTRLNNEARSVITIENDEVGSGLDDVLEIADLCPIVLDIHHHWVHSGGEMIAHDDPRLVAVQMSWEQRNRWRPVIHYSYSRLIEQSHSDLNESEITNTTDWKKQKLRAHSDGYPNPVFNRWAHGFNEWADIMCESKDKDKAVQQFIEVR